MSDFSRNMKALAKTNRRINNYKKCAYCGKVIYRCQSRQEKGKNYFCSRSHAGMFKHEQLKVVRSFRRRTDYNQRAWGVSPEIALLLMGREVNPSG